MCKQPIDVQIVNHFTNNRDCHMLADMIHEVWGAHIGYEADRARLGRDPYTRLTPGLMADRLNSEQTFFIAYATPTAEQLPKLEERYGYYDLEGPLPCGIMETIALRTDGDINQAKLPYDELTDGGLWVPRPAITDTLIFVDITASQYFRVEGTGKAILNKGKEFVAAHPNFTLAITYTPDDKDSRWVHLNRMDAILSNTVIPNARPWYKIQDVRFTIYHDSRT